MLDTSSDRLVILHSTWLKILSAGRAPGGVVRIKNYLFLVVKKD